MGSKIENAEDALTRAMTLLQVPQPFFAHLLMRMRPEVMPAGAPMQSMGVDARGRLFYNREFVMSLSEEQLQGVLCHEVMHVALLHMLRRGNREPQFSNIAQDVAVNAIVWRSNLVLPQGTVPYDMRKDCSCFSLGPVRVVLDRVSEKSWEQLYAELLEQVKDQREKLPENPRSRLGFDEHMEGSGDGEGELSEQEVRELEQVWQQALAEAATYAKQRGKLPGGMQRLMEELFRPRVAWRQMLMKYLRPYLSPVDWSYQRPHRKSQVLDVFLPSVVKERCEVEVVVDTSGSIGKKELSEFLSEIVGIARSMRHVHLWVTFVDSVVQARYEVSNGSVAEILAMEPKGGGGTSMEKGLSYVREVNASVPVVVVLTDGYDVYVKRRQDYPFEVIWCVTASGVDINEWRNGPSYGRRIKMDA